MENIHLLRIGLSSCRQIDAMKTVPELVYRGLDLITTKAHGDEATMTNNVSTHCVVNIKSFCLLCNICALYEFRQPAPTKRNCRPYSRMIVI